jgi:hypothetical protein
VDKNRNIATKLVEEIEDNDEDIYLANNLVDTDNNAPKSILFFLTWLTSPQSPMANFDFVIITDDSSFVALDKVMPKLHHSLSSDTTGDDSSNIF